MRLNDRGAAPGGTDDAASDAEAWLALRGAAREALGSVRRHAVAIGWAILACTGAALAVAAMRPAVYLGTAQVLLDPRGLNVTSNEVVPSPPSADVNDAIIETQTRFLASDAVLRRVVGDQGLQGDPEFAPRPGWLARLRGLAGFAPADAAAADPVGAAAAALARQTTFEREGKSFVVKLSVRANAADKAARVATAVGRAFVADVERRRREIVARAREAMAATLKSQGERVVAAEDAVERYKRAISVVDADGRVLNTARLAELNSQLLSARGATRTLAAKLAQLDARQTDAKRADPRRPDAGGAGAAPEAAGTDALESPVLTQLKVNLAEVTRQQDNLRATLGPRHPAAVEAEAQVRSLRAALLRETTRLHAAARSDLAGARAREQSLEREVARIEAETARTNGALVPLRQLEREALAQRSVYEKSLGRERELLEQESVGTTNASLVSAAKPAEAVGLRPGLLLAAGALLGALLGCAGAVLHDRRGGRVHTAADLRARTGLDVIGVLPLADARPDGRPAIASLLDAGSASARALHRLADALDEAGPVRLLVLSAGAGAISTVVASNLVLAQASRGRRALLVDGDARSGRLTWLVPREREAGAASGAVSCTVEGFPPFEAVSAGAGRADPLGDRAEGHDCVVIDGGTGVDEVRLRRLAAAASAVVLVAEAGVSTAAGIADLRAALLSSADKLAGALLVVPGPDAMVPAPARARPLPRRFGPLAARDGFA